MIRGAIESLAGNQVNGWIYAPVANFRGSTVLAFVDDVCVGAGKVELYRADLAEAGLGDGYLGFSFWVTVRNRADLARLVVRLDGSDAVLLQRGSRVVDGTPHAPAPRQASLSDPAALVRWLRTRGWLSQADYDLARYLPQFGVYDRSLVMPVEPPGQAAPRLADVVPTAADLLRLVTLSDAAMEQESLAAPEEIARIAALRGHDGGLIMALWSKGHGCLDAVPGSHLGLEAAAGELAEIATLDTATLADQAIGPDRLLFVDSRCRLGAGAFFPAEGVQAFFIPAR
ncbi:hypothetical protein NON00_07100 [Roseomonas sp. GC11]|uniref:hypothetical protein n=1 Tax=Roseomonas sp. GC11 TaxID=2950546 RepID=UPI00210A2BB8|nr:hypothetical protein [Roseomonas sp. GC11]MCQ4159691.1 hypothetical protein [Roseomonas sp. GC11]